MDQRITRRRLSGLLALGFFSALCGTRRVFADPPATQPSLDGLQMWMNGQKDAAVDAFIAADWHDGAFIGSDPQLSLNELDFLKNSRSDPSLKNSVTDKAFALSDYIDAVLKRGDTLGTGGKGDDSRHAYASVKQCGQWIVSRPDRIHLLLIMGQQMVKNSDQRLFNSQTQPTNPPQ